tara:strand:+ start:3539 stop:5173 length:1635 start_codon:yes stop_codon:yes gene_type:complete
MSATLELKYFNTFWLKQIKTLSNATLNGNPIAPVFNNATSTENLPLDFTVTTSATVDTVAATNLIFTLTSTPNPPIQPGLNVTGTGVVAGTYVASVSNTLSVTRITLNQNNAAIVDGTVLTFSSGVVTITEASGDDWFIEESRIRGGYNNTSVDLGVKAYLVEDEPNQQHRFNTMIYSGIYNSRTGVNNTNQFSIAESITRSVDPSNRSIQRLYAEDTNLIIFQETKVSKSLIDKDAIYSAEGGAAITTSPLVIGQNIAYAGNFGISTNPESFAVYGYRKYFVDRERNVVLRLSQDGISEISNYGMMDFFRDKLSLVGSTGKIIGGWDMHNKVYTVSLQPPSSDNFTLTFDEAVRGWTSFFSFFPSSMISLDSNFYSFYEGKIFQHYMLAAGNTDRAKYYGVTYSSDVTFIFNSQKSVVKNFNTINYEGSPGWSMASLNTSLTTPILSTSNDQALPIAVSVNITTLEQMQNNFNVNNFKRRENKYFANVVNQTLSQQGEVVWGQSMTGIKGFFAVCKMTSTNTGLQTGKQELFAVSTNFVESSY